MGVLKLWLWLICWLLQLYMFNSKTKNKTNKNNMFQGRIVYYKPADYCLVINVKVNRYGLLLHVSLKKKKKSRFFFGILF